jgi:hypothetical protein
MFSATETGIGFRSLTTPPWHRKWQTSARVVTAKTPAIPAQRPRACVTTLGEAVAEALPDQERVKAVISEHKPGRRRKKRRVKRQ